MKTIADIIHQNKFPLNILNNNGNIIYFENSDGRWEKHQYITNGNQIYYEDSTGLWVKCKYDENNNRTYFENSMGWIIAHEKYS